MPTVQGTEDTVVAPRDAATRIAEAQNGAAELARGALVGRYIILSKLGAGGMGIVYAAFDPELDRKVAIKLLLPDLVGNGHARLLREAQALAKLSDPHVVAVHDVGSIGEQVWLAMEFVEGWTLRTWLTEQRRQKRLSWRTITDIMCGAGRGLAAAHAAGLLHRDFKPENVMVGRDGRVRVMDFGLACARYGAVKSASLSLGAAPAESTAVPALRALQLRLTQTGAVEGTPAYMAPEQFRGDAITASADQFAFCVTLWEALHGERPFAGDTLLDLAANILAGKPRPPPSDARVPAWLRRACERGLSPEPDRRWPSVEALLEVLARDPSRRPRYIAAGLVVVGLVAGATYAITRQTAQSQLCQGAERELAGVWNDARRATLADAFVATDASFAPETARRVTRLLDEYASTWTGLHAGTCQRHQRGEISAPLLDRAMACLQQRRDEFAALVDALTEINSETINQAVQAAARLPHLARCGDVESLLAATPPPEDPDVAQEVQSIRDGLARLLALEYMGAYDRGLTFADSLAPRIDAVAYSPVQAEYLLRRGSLYMWRHDYPEAATFLKQAAIEASGAGADELAVEALAKWIYAAGYGLGRVSEANSWYPLALAWTRKLKDSREARALLANNMGAVRTLEGKIRESIDLTSEARDLWSQVHGPAHIEVGFASFNLSLALGDVGRCTEAYTVLESAVQVLKQAIGPMHPQFHVVNCNRGWILACIGKRDEARDQDRRCIHDGALSPLARAAPILNLAYIDLDEAALQAAEDGFNLALELFSEEADFSPLRLDATNGLGRVALARGDLNRAEELFARSVAMCAELGLSGHYCIDAETGRAEVMLLGGGATVAAEKLRALIAREALIDSERPWLLARARFALARAAYPANNSSAVEFARKASDAFAAGGHRNDGERARIASWIAEFEPKH